MRALLARAFRGLAAASKRLLGRKNSIGTATSQPPNLNVMREKREAAADESRRKHHAARGTSFPIRHPFRNHSDPEIQAAARRHELRIREEWERRVDDGILARAENRERELVRFESLTRMEARKRIRARAA